MKTALVPLTERGPFADGAVGFLLTESQDERSNLRKRRTQTRRVVGKDVVSGGLRRIGAGERGVLVVLAGCTIVGNSLQQCVIYAGSQADAVNDHARKASRIRQVAGCASTISSIGRGIQHRQLQVGIGLLNLAVRVVQRVVAWKLESISKRICCWIVVNVVGHSCRRSGNILSTRGRTSAGTSDIGVCRRV